MEMQSAERKSVAPDCVLLLHVARGTRVVCLQSRVHVTSACTWLAERMVERTILLEEGECLQLADGGWIRMQARQAAEILLLRQASAFARYRPLASSALFTLLRLFSGARAAVRRKSLKGLS